jgi:hypothetical protein
MMKFLMGIALACGAAACAVSADPARDESDLAVSQTASELSSGRTPQITCPGNPAHPPCCELDEDDPHVCAVFRVCEAGGWICP